MILKIAVCLLIIKSINCQFNITNKFSMQSANSGSTECIGSVIRKYFPCGSLMTLVDSRTNDELIKILEKDSECYLFITRSFYDEDWYIPTEMYVIRGEDLTEFSEGFLTITNDLLWNPRGRFIIELKTLYENEVDNVFNILVSHNVYDVILIRNSNNELLIDTYFPLKDDNCGKRVKVVTIGHCRDIAHLEWIFDKVYSLSNCTIVIATSQSIPNFIFDNSYFNGHGKPLRGMEQLLLETIADKENIKLKYVLKKREHSKGVILPNHTATGLLSSLQNKEADVAAGGLILIRNRVLLFDYVWGYNYVSFNVYTPTLGEEIWKIIYKVFSKETWFLILMAFCLVGLTSKMKQRLFLRRNENQSSMTLKLLGYLFLNTSSALSKDKRYKTVMLFWIWFTFFMCNFYNTELYSLLTGRKEIKRHISVDRLRELPFEPCISVATRTYYLFAFHKRLPQGSNNSECKYSDTALTYVATKKKSYSIDSDLVFKLHKYKYVNEKGTSMLDTWTFSNNLPIAMYFDRGFPLRDKFQHYALRMYESGILKKNLEEIYRNKNYRPSQLRRTHYEKILLADLRIHFYILLLGHILSMFCLILEILWDRNSWRVRYISYTN